MKFSIFNFQFSVKASPCLPAGRFAIFFTLIILFGAGCAENNPGPLDFEKMRQALYGAADNLGWDGEVIEKPASEENYYGKSYVLSGPFKQEGAIDETVLIDNIEMIEFENPAYAQKSYGEEECFKGQGQPVKIYGMDGCCLNDNKKGASRAVMARENYILRAFDYFHADCGAAEYLKSFWKSYLNK